MKPSKEELSKLLALKQFPRAAKYDPEWVMQNQMGPNALWLAEWVCELMDLKPGMRVLDMGCGKALSSIFLAREFDVEVWANDLWIKASENWERIRAAGLEKRVFPIHAEAHELPYADEFFDAIVSLDSYHYYGTDDMYLRYFINFLKPGGRIGMAVPGLVREFEDGVPEHLTRPQSNGAVFWAEDCWTFHTVDWWRNLWGRTTLVEVEHAGLLADGWRIWRDWEKVIRATGEGIFPPEDEALEADQGRYMGFVRMIARRKHEQYNKRTGVSISEARLEEQ
jgi:cyclopropane fatty-acyl-phospholipid synthase-like methyltransferase